jgi:hypothetical protein
MTNQHMPKGGHAPMKYSGSPETFQHDPVGTFTFSSFPTGWFDFASVGVVPRAVV